MIFSMLHVLFLYVISVEKVLGSLEMSATEDMNIRMQLIEEKLKNMVSELTETKRNCDTKDTKIMQLEEKVYHTNKRVSALEQELAEKHKVMQTLETELTNTNTVVDAAKMIFEKHEIIPAPDDSKGKTFAISTSLPVSNHGNLLNITKSHENEMSTGSLGKRNRRSSYQNNFGSAIQNHRGSKGQSVNTVSPDWARVFKFRQSVDLLVSDKSSQKRVDVSGPVCCENDRVAFYTYLSVAKPSVTVLQTLDFDVVKLNIKNGYNKFSGAFTAPQDGIYFFSWSVAVYCHSYMYTELVRNSEAVGAIVTDTEEACDNDYSTGNVILSLNQGDVVFIRTGSYHTPKGIINSSAALRTSFSGFKIN